MSVRTIKRQRAKDAKSVIDYHKWVSSMTAEEFKKLEDLGISKPDVSYYGRAAAKEDFADSPAASYWPDIDPILDLDHDNENEKEACPFAQAGEILCRFVAAVLSHKNIRLTMECMALAVGLRVRNGKSMTAIAKNHGITVEAVRKHCVKIAKEFGINRKPEQAHSLLVKPINILRHFVAEVIALPNILLTMECMALVVNLSAFDGRSMTAIAKDHGISASAVSRRCVNFAKEFRIKNSRAMRSVAARDAYQAGQLKRNRKEQP